MESQWPVSGSFDVVKVRGRQRLEWPKQRDLFERARKALAAFPAEMGRETLDLVVRSVFSALNRTPVALTVESILPTYDIRPSVRSYFFHWRTILSLSRGRSDKRRILGSAGVTNTPVLRRVFPAAVSQGESFLKLRVGAALGPSS